MIERVGVMRDERALNVLEERRDLQCQCRRQYVRQLKDEVVTAGSKASSSSIFEQIRVTTTLSINVAIKSFDFSFALLL